MHWKNEFDKSGTGTKVNVEITFSSVADLVKIVEIGFKEGFSMGHKNLDELLAIVNLSSASLVCNAPAE